MLETERLSIRKFTEDDLPRLIEMRDDDDVVKYLGGRRLQSPEAIAARFRRYLDAYEKYGFGSCAMIWKETGETFGWSGLMPLEETGEIEVGYGMIKRFWGRGIGSEAARAWLEFGFREKNLPRIVAVALPANASSRRIMEKCGMRYEKTIEHFGERCVLYAVTKDEFLADFAQRKKTGRGSNGEGRIETG